VKKYKIIIKDSPNADYNINKKLLDALDTIVEKRDKNKTKNNESTL